MTRGGADREREEAPLRRAPQLAVLVEGGDRLGLLHDMTAAILDHGGDILQVEIVERGARSAVYWELDRVLDPDGLPVGVQLVGPRWSEPRLLGIARELERAGVLPGFRPPPGF